VIASNYSNQEQTATFTKQAGTAHVCGEHRAIPMEAQGVTDRFDPYDAHIYELDCVRARRIR
jgi:hypothetical protein